MRGWGVGVGKRSFERAEGAGGAEMTQCLLHFGLSLAASSSRWAQHCGMTSRLIACCLVYFCKIISIHTPIPSSQGGWQCLVLPV